MSPNVRRLALTAALALAAPAFAQTDPAIQAIRDRGVGANNAAERMMDADAAADAEAQSGEQRVRDERDTPDPAAPLPEGEIEVGTVDTTPLDADEEPDPAADAEDAAADDLPEL